jgi:hypothetical protein
VSAQALFPLVKYGKLTQFFVPSPSSMCFSLPVADVIAAGVAADPSQMSPTAAKLVNIAFALSAWGIRAFPNASYQPLVPLEHFALVAESVTTSSP